MIKPAFKAFIIRLLLHLIDEEEPQRAIVIDRNHPNIEPPQGEREYNELVKDH